MTGKIIVAGILNMDLIVTAMRHPKIGETILGENSLPRPAARVRIRPLLRRAWEGVLVVNANGRKKLPAFTMQAVDTIAAGDAFVGTLLATELNEKMDVEAAVCLDIAAAGISVTRWGTQPSLPTRAEVNQLMNTWQD